MHIPFAFLLIAFLSLSACSDKDRGAPSKKDAGAPSSEIKELQRACQDDIRKFCKKVKPGEGRIPRCLREHQKELSGDCRKALKERAESSERK